MTTAPVQRGYKFATIPEWVLFHPELTHLAIRVYGILDRHGSTEHDCYPSHARIAKLAGVSQRSVAEPIRLLERVGALRRVVRLIPGTEEQTSNGYRLAGDAPLNVPPTLESVDPPRCTTGTPHAQERAKRESVERESVERENTPDPLAADAASVSEDRTDPELMAKLAASVAAVEEAKARRDAARRPTLELVAEEPPAPPAPSFEDFYEAYDKKRAPHAARKAWVKAVKSGADPVVIVEAARAYRGQAKFRDSKQFMKDPAAWLNQGCWDDELEPSEDELRAARRRRAVEAYKQSEAEKQAAHQRRLEAAVSDEPAPGWVAGAGDGDGDYGEPF